MSVGQGVEEGGWGGGKVLGRHCQVRSGEQSSVLYSEVGVEVGGRGGIWSWKETENGRQARLLISSSDQGLPEKSMGGHNLESSDRLLQERQLVARREQELLGNQKECVQEEIG